MAGYVKADRYRIPGSSVLQLVARVCPFTDRHREVCQQYDPHSGIVQWCPLLYGLRVKSEVWHRAEARTPESSAQLMAAADDSPLQSYTCLCLAQSQSTVEVGATSSW